MASFAGATSFQSGFQDVLVSPNYDNPYVLGYDLAQWMYTYNCPAIDLDIEHIPNIETYPDTASLAVYIGQLSDSIKSECNLLFGYYPQLSHAPQPPYFNGTQYYAYYGYVYSEVERLYGYAIDFYNIQYYNQGNYSYTDYNRMFTFDPDFNASVLQLIDPSTIGSIYNYTAIPIYKIVVGKPSNENEVSTQNGFVYLYSSDSSYTKTMAKYVVQNKTSTDTRLVEWYNTAGTMIWLYLTNQVSGYYPNSQLLSYFNSTKH